MKMPPEEKADQPKKVQNVQGSALSDRPVFVGVPRDQVKSIEVGDEITVSVTGEVFGVRKLDKDNPDKDNYEIELRTAKKVEVQSNQADMAYKKMIEQK